MPREVLDVLLQFGPFAVLVIAAGAIVAALITAANAWAVAWFNARATRQLAIDAAHREYRQQWCADLLEQAQLLDGLALQITNVFGWSLDADVPVRLDDAQRVTAYAKDHFAKVKDPDFRRPSPPDELLIEAFRRAARAERHLQGALRELEATVTAGSRANLSSHRRDVVIAATAVGHATSILHLAVERFVFNLGGASRRRVKRLLADKG